MLSLRTATNSSFRLPRRKLVSLAYLRTFTASSIARQEAQKTKISSNYRAPPAPKSRGNNSQLPVLPLIAIFALGSVSFYYLAKSRQGQGQSHYVLPERGQLSKEEKRNKPRQSEH